MQKTKTNYIPSQEEFEMCAAIANDIGQFMILASKPNGLKNDEDTLCIIKQPYAEIYQILNLKRGSTDKTRIEGAFSKKYASFHEVLAEYAEIIKNKATVSKTLEKIDNLRPEDFEPSPDDLIGKDKDFLSLEIEVSGNFANNLIDMGQCPVFLTKRYLQDKLTGDLLGLSINPVTRQISLVSHDPQSQITTVLEDKMTLPKALLKMALEIDK